MLSPTAKEEAAHRRGLDATRTRREQQKIVLPSAALGILSGSTPAHARRRTAIRESWLKFDTSVILTRFVLRCKGSAEARAEARASPLHTVCAPLDESCRGVGCRSRGVILALVFWLRHALSTWPSVQFVAKADDDVFLRLPEWESLLLSIPQPLRPHAVFGSIRFFSAVVGSQATPRVELRAYAPTYPYALMTARRQRLRETACAGDAGANGTLSAVSTSTVAVAAASVTAPGCRVLGPFPYPCGQAFALGSDLLRALLAHPAFEAELARISALPDGSALVTEDGWLGIVLYRSFSNAATASLSRHRVSRDPALPRLFTLAGENHLVVDPINYRLITTRGAIVYHNRNVAPNPLPRWYKRLPLLFRFAKAAPCNATNGWRKHAYPCCASKRRRSGGHDIHALGAAAAHGAQPREVDEPTLHWPTYQVRLGACPDARQRYDLGDRAVLERWKLV